jgi:hypothetical protein
MIIKMIIMKRSWHLLAIALLLAGCTKSVSSPPPAPVAKPAEPPAAEAPKPPALLAGPVYLLSKPDKPLWPGPAAVVVENSPQSRPQAGLNDADLVVEALSESEISRMLAFYWSKPAEKIGPVRSARSHTVTVSAAYGGAYAHAGGNDDALATLRQSAGARNLDEIYGAGGYFWRSNDRAAPHNLYTSTKLLDQAIRERNIPTAAVSTTPQAVNPSPPATMVTHAEVTWHRLNQVVWEWDGKQYRRQEDGRAQTLESGDQIHTPNLVFLEVQGVNHGPDLGWALALDQGGKATVLSGGVRWEGQWTLGKGGFSLQPAGDKVPPLVPGNVWVHLITRESSFSVK